MARRQPASPSDAAVGRQAGVIDDDGRGREVAGELGRGIEVPPGRLQVEVELVPFEQGEPLPPARTIHRARRAAPGVLPTRRSLRLVAHAPHQWERRLLGQHLAHVRAVEPGLGDHGAGEAVPRSRLVHPARLADGIARVPLGLDVDSLDDVEGARVAAVVVGKVCAPDGGVVAVAERDHRLIDEPGMRPESEVPEMMMRVDDRQPGSAAVPLPLRGGARGGRSLDAHVRRLAGRRRG